MNRTYRYIIGISLCWLFCYMASALAAKDNDPLTYEITGINGDPKANAQKRLELIKQSFEKEVTPAEIRRFMDLSPSAIRKALAPYGYLHPEINHRLRQRKGKWHVKFEVKPGPKLKISQVDIQITGEGRNHKTLTRAVKNFPLKRRDQFNAETYESGKSDLVNKAMAQGFLQAQITDSKVYIDKSSNRARIMIHLDSGPQYYFGPTYFTENPLSDRFLQRYLNYQANDPYRSAKIQSLQRDLSNSGYFREVQVIPQKRDSRNYYIPIKVALTARSQMLYQIGVGAGSDSGPRLSTTLLLRRLNRRGHQLAFSGRLSTRHQRLQANYMIPGRKPATERYTISAAIFFEDYANGRTHKRVLALHSVKHLWGLQQTLGLSLQNEHSKPTNKQSFTTTMLMPSADWLYVNQGKINGKTAGYKLLLSLQGGATELLSDVDFLQGKLYGKWLRPLPLHNRLDLEGTAGLMTVSDLSELPLSLQFWTGGSKKLRGYDYLSIGTGRKLLEGSIQLQHEIWNSLYLGPFYDVGNASDDPFRDIQSSVGMALTWASPVGAIELSAAHALTDRGKSFKIQFSMGPEL